MVWLETAKAPPPNGGVTSTILNKNPLGAQIERTTTRRAFTRHLWLGIKEKKCDSEAEVGGWVLIFSGTTALS